MNNHLGISRKPHPAKEVFDRFNTPLWAVAQRLGLSYTHTCAILQGTIKCSKKHDEVLKMSARKLEEDAKSKEAEQG